MALSTTGLLDVLATASGMAQEELKFENLMLDSCYKQIKGMVAEFGETMNINVPRVNEGDVIDIGGGPLQPSEESHDTYPIKLNINDSVSFVVKDWDKARTAVDLKELYLKPKMEALLRKCNRRVANLINIVNFPNYTTLAGGTDTFTRPNLARAWANLKTVGVPVTDGKLIFITQPLPYSNMMADTSFYQESVVGVEASVATIQRATIAPQFNARILSDQHIPTVAGKYSAFFGHPTAIGMVQAKYPRSEDPSVKESIIFPKKDFACRMQAQYSLRDQGTLVHIHAIYGIAVIRPEYGQYLEAV